MDGGRGAAGAYGRARAGERRGGRTAPKAAPIWHEGACVTAAACPTAPHFDPPTLTAVGPRENALEAAAPAERTPSAAGIVIVLVVVAALLVLVMVRRRGGRAPQGGLSAMDGAKDLQGV